MKTSKLISAIKSHRKDDERGAAIILFLMLTVILGTVLLTILYGTISGSKTLASTRDATLFDLAARSALSDALRVANEEGWDELKVRTPGNPKTGTLSDDPNVSWKWHVVQPPHTVVGNVYDVYASGYRGSEPHPETERKLVGRIEAVQTSGARWLDGVIQYKPTRSSIFAWGVIGSKSVSLGGNTKIQTYDSANNSPPTPGSVSTNGGLSVGSSTQVGAALFTASRPGFSSTERCVGGKCGTLDISELSYGMDLGVVREWAAAECRESTEPNDGREVWRDQKKDPDPDASPDAKAAALAAHISLNTTKVNCLDSLTLGAGPASINWMGGAGRPVSSGAPAIIFVKGDIKIAAGAKFNTTPVATGAPAANALSYRIFSIGDSIEIGSAGSNAGTDVRALIGAATADCTVGNSGNNAVFTGALSCGGNVNISQSATTKWDKQVSYITREVNDTDRPVWDYRIIGNG